MNQQQAIEVARQNATAAKDQAADYADPVESFRCNVIDTLAENGGTEHEAVAVAHFMSLMGA